MPQTVLRTLLAAASSVSLVCAAPQACAQSSAPAPVGGAPSSFADIFARVAPAVVSLTVVLPASAEEGPSAEDLPFPFNQLPQFQRRSPGGRPSPGGGVDSPPEAQAAGSGFFITADGYVVTNNHVVADATKITVTLSDGRALPARLIGRDEATDLAVIKVDGTGFAYVSFETTVKPRVGDWVMAVGNPLQLGGTATAGIVSYVGRDLADLRTPLADFLQISAPITFGNSGGPTFDTYGRVVGVNAAIAAQGGVGGGGIGFAIPADIADGVVRQLMTGQSLKRGYLGATIQGLDAEGAEALGLPLNTGAEVAGLTPGGPGEKAGLRVGDIVLSLDGHKVVSSSALTRGVAGVHAGDIFRLGIRREGRDLTLSVVAGVRPAESALSADAANPDGGAENPAPGVVARPYVLGLVLLPVTTASRRTQAYAGPTGLVVDKVRPGSDAARKGLQPGDVIVQANQQPLSTAGEFASVVEAARRAGRSAVFLLVSRDGRATGLPVALDRAAAR